MRFLDRCTQKVRTYVRERVVFSAPGLTFPIAVRLLVRYRAHIEAKYFPRVLFILTASLVVSVLSLFDRLVFRRSAGSNSVQSQTSDAPAVFILGYWRSGTTHSTSCCPRSPLCDTTLFEATVPHCYLALDGLKPSFHGCCPDPDTTRWPSILTLPGKTKPRCSR